MDPQSPMPPEPNHPVDAIGRGRSRPPKRGPGEPRRGPLPSRLDDSQQAIVLEKLRSGLRRAAACEAAGVKWRAFRNTLKTDPAFRDAVLMAERSRGEQLFTILYAAALDGDLAACRFLFDRELRARRLQRARREARRHRDRVAGTLLESDATRRAEAEQGLRLWRKEMIARLPDLGAPPSDPVSPGPTPVADV